MAAPREPFQQVKQIKTLASITPEQKYWRKFRPQPAVPIPSRYPVTHIAYPPSSSTTTLSTPTQQFAVTAGPRIQIYSVRDGALIKTISRFDDIAHSGELRRDGRLVVAGDETGTIQVFDVNSRTIIKTWKEYKQPVWVTKFSPAENTKLLSASDDQSVRLFDLTEGKSTGIFRGHTDYVRSGAFVPGQEGHLFVSGSYDQTVKLWDSRLPAANAVMTFKHAAPVEEVVPLPSGTIMLAAAGNQISVLDLVAARPAQVLRQHQKTVSSLCLASKGSRALSGGLDGHLKVYETSTWNVVYSSKYPSPILSINVIPSASSGENKHLAVGLESGELRLRTFPSKSQTAKAKEEPEISYAYEALTAQPDTASQKKKRKLTQGQRAVMRGRDFTGEGADIIIEGATRTTAKKEKPYQLNLRKGNYSLALDQALSLTDPATVHSLLINLRYRSALRAALANRDDLGVVPIFEWTCRYIAIPKYSRICTQVIVILIDEYSVHLGGESEELDKVWGKMKRRVEKEVEVGMASQRVVGMLEMVMEGGMD